MKVSVRREMNNGAGCRTVITLEDEIPQGKSQMEIESYLNAIGFRPQGRIKKAWHGLFG